MPRLLDELRALLGSCGGAFDEFGVVLQEDDDAVWSYDAEHGAVSLGKRHVVAVWREALVEDDDASTLATLLLSGDSYTAWNKRKANLVGATLPPLQTELRLNAAVLRRHGKAASAWAHRRWCAAAAMRLETGTTAIRDAEFALCASLAQRHPRNYAAWCHRAWLVGQESATGARRELDWVIAWLRRSVTDYSAAHYATFVAALLLAHDPASTVLDDLGAVRTELAQQHAHLVTPGGAIAYLERSIARCALEHRRRLGAAAADATTPWLRAAMASRPILHAA